MVIIRLQYYFYQVIMDGLIELFYCPKWLSLFYEGIAISSHPYQSFCFYVFGRSSSPGKDDDEDDDVKIMVSKSDKDPLHANSQFPV